jgi:hypothetical protein
LIQHADKFLDWYPGYLRKSDMTKRVGFIGLLLVLWVGWLTTVDAWSRGYVEGELLVRYKPTTPMSVRKTLSQKHELKPLRTFSRLGIHHVKLPEGMTVEEAIKRLKLEKHVAHVEPNYRRKAHTTPDDPQWPSQWALQKIQMPFAWEITQGSTEVTVALLDTGIYALHPDLAENLWVNAGETNCSDGIDNDGNGRVDDCRGWNFYDSNNNIDDGDGHGTHVAGIIGAAGNNSLGVTGVAWRVKIMPVRFIGAGGGSVSDEILGIEYAMQNGARIINASFGCDTDYPEDCAFSVSEYEGIRAARDAGVLFVAAAGNGWNNNDGGVRNYPSSYCIDTTVGNDTYPGLANILAVAGTDTEDNLADYSNWGATSVHIAAPGSGILSTSTNPTYASMSGTSMATAFVSGAAALLLAAKPDATFGEVKTTLLQSVDQVPALDSIVLSGGRLNVYRALLSIQPVSSIALSSGWNFVSLPRQPPDVAITTVLASVLPHVRVVWGFDNDTKGWKRFKPQGDTTLATMEQGKGYWMFLDDDGTIDMAGWTLPTTTVTVYPGWNLVGFSGRDGAAADTELLSLLGHWEILWTWGSSIWSAKHESVADLSVPPINSFQQRNAYWIKLYDNPPSNSKSEYRNPKQYRITKIQNGGRPGLSVWNI